MGCRLAGNGRGDQAWLAVPGVISMSRTGTIAITVPFAAINLDDLAETCHKLPGSTPYGTQTMDQCNSDGPRPARI